MCVERLLTVAVVKYDDSTLLWFSLFRIDHCWPDDVVGIGIVAQFRRQQTSGELVWHQRVGVLHWDAAEKRQRSERCRARQIVWESFKSDGCRYLRRCAGRGWEASGLRLRHRICVQWASCWRRSSSCCSRCSSARGCLRLVVAVPCRRRPGCPYAWRWHRTSATFLDTLCACSQRHVHARVVVCQKY